MIDGGTPVAALDATLAAVDRRLEALSTRCEVFVPRAERSFGDLLATLSEGSPVSPARGFDGAVGSIGDAAVERAVVSAAREQGLDPALLRAVVRVESGGDPFARSRAGAEGLMQLMPGTAKSMGVTDPFDAMQNVRGGAAYLRSLLDRFGDVRLALAAYNAGPGAVERAGGIPPFAETKAYVERVTRAAELFRPAR